MQINKTKANITESDLDTIRSVIPQYYTPKRLAHTLSVERECAALAKYTIFQSKTPCVRAAALLHDITKDIWREQLAYCTEHNIAFTDEETHIPKILHSRTGAHFARKLFPGLVDDGIYEAIYYHTTAKPAMEPLTALLYLADYIEPERDFEDCVKLRSQFYALLEEKDKYDALSEALVVSFGYTLSSLLCERSLVHVDIVAARNYYLLQINKDKSEMNNTKTRKPNKRKTASWQLVLIVVLSVFIVATVFTGGYLLRSLLIKPQTGKPTLIRFTPER